MRRFPLIVLGLVVLAVGGKYVYGVINKPDDKVLIKQALAEAVQAGKEGRSGSVIDKLSENFKVNGEHPGMTDIAKFVKESHPDLTIKDNDPLVSGDTARITSDIDVKASFLGQTVNRSFKDVVLEFKKETATDWGIFPTSKWHLSAARVSEQDMASFNN